MTESILASYTSFRYYPELVSAGVLPDATADNVLAFRESRGGTLLGMTRFEAHLDNMPAFGYARAALRLMEAPTGPAAARWYLLTAGHAAGYMSRGTFSASEQLAVAADGAGQWRDYLWEYLEGGIDQCVPSLMLAPLSTLWALLFEWRPQPDTLWLARGAPRRWFDDGGFAVENAPTSFGIVSFSAAAAAAAAAGAAAGASTTANATTVFSVAFAPPPFAAPRAAGGTPLTLVLRVRALAPGSAMVGAVLVDVTPSGARVALVSSNATAETATVELAPPFEAVAFAVRAFFAAGGAGGF